MGSREVDMNGDRCSFEEDEVEFPKIFDNCKDCGIQYEIHDQWKHCDCWNTNEKTKLPITALLEERRKDLRLLFPIPHRLYECPECRDMIIDLSDNLIPQVKSLEEAQQKKAKEEEREKIVGILEEMKGDKISLLKWIDNLSISSMWAIQRIEALQEAITRITN